MRRTKYGSQKIKADGMIFDSRKEYKRYQELRLLEKAGAIRELKRQVKFMLIPSQRDEKTGKVIERACSYTADFTYLQGSELVVEDTKGYRTKDYILKRKMMLYFCGIRIKET